MIKAHTSVQLILKAFIDSISKFVSLLLELEESVLGSLVRYIICWLSEREVPAHSLNRLLFVFEDRSQASRFWLFFPFAIGFSHIIS